MLSRGTIADMLLSRNEFMIVGSSRGESTAKASGMAKTDSDVEVLMLVL
jgi:hypothetical protein